MTSRMRSASPIKLILVDTMDQVLEAALRRKPKALVAEPPKVVKGDDPLDTPSEPQSRVRRTNFPPTDHPPVVVQIVVGRIRRPDGRAEGASEHESERTGSA